MSKRDVLWYLSQKPRVPPSRYEALKRSNPDLTPHPDEVMDDARERLYFLARTFYKLEENFARTQKWVREEMKTKGYVEVDDDWVKGRAKVKSVFEEGLKKIQAKFDSLPDDAFESGDSGDEGDSDDYEEEDDDDY